MKDQNKPIGQLDSKGHLVVKLPIAKTEMTFRPMKGRDLKVLDQMTRNGAGDFEVMLTMITQLNQNGLSLEQVEDLDFVDLEEVGKALQNFRELRMPKQS